MKDTISALVADPALAVDDIISCPRVRAGLAGYFIGALGFAIWSGLKNPGSASLFGFCLTTGIWACIDIFIGACFAAVSHMFLDFAGGKGHALSLFVAFGLADAIKILLMPLGLISGALGGRFSGMFFLGVIILQVVGAVKMTDRIYGAGKLKSSVAVFLPVGIALLPLLLLVAVALAAIVMAISSISLSGIAFGS